jgi:hypothetical protein
MNERLWFWSGFTAIVVVTLGLGFGIVPNWPRYFQTQEQRISYLYESIWCPI